MRSLFAMILAMMLSMPAVATAQQEQTALRRVHVMTGAGTIPRNPANRLEYLRYATTGEPRLTGKQMLERIPEVQKFARVTVESDEFIPYDQPHELKALSLQMSARLADPDISGVVFTHGTNTIEETAYFMNLTVRSEKPVVIVGAQRPFSTLSSDGPLNLLNAIRVAGDPASRGKGALVVLNDEINAAREVTKSNTYRVETFQSRELGILGYADPDRIVFYRAPTRRHTTQSQFDLTQIDAFPKVDILYAHSGDDGNLAKAAVGAGRVVRDDNWQEPGFVAADNLSPQKARILLQLALTKTSKPDEIQQMFDEY